MFLCWLYPMRVSARSAGIMRGDEFMQVRKLRLVLEYAKVILGFARVVAALLNMGINYHIPDRNSCAV
jgi:hypothetical protein